MEKTAILVFEFDRSNFEGLKFDFICDEKYLTIQKSSLEAVEWFKNYTGQDPISVKQVSKYPSRS